MWGNTVVPCNVIIWLGLVPSRSQILLSWSSVSQWVNKSMGMFVQTSSENVLGWFHCKSHFHFKRDVSCFLAEVLWTVCQTQYAHKDTESDSCRLQVCSFTNIKIKGLGLWPWPTVWIVFNPFPLNLYWPRSLANTATASYFQHD